jgi:hypothetical protein
MKIREGAYYRTRGGHVFGPMVWDKDPTINYPWHIVSTEPEVCWDKRGFWLITGTSQLDLISEVYVSDTPAPEAKTLRDEFAMAVVSGVYIHWRTSLDKTDSGVDFLDIAEMAYGIADAMMEARKK